MKIEELIKHLNDKRINASQLIGFTMEDYSRECPYFIRKYNSKWQVFYWSERGTIHNLCEFNTEDEATTYILQEIRADMDKNWFIKSYCMK